MQTHRAFSLDDTIVASASPVGSSWLGIWRLSGLWAFSILEKIWPDANLDLSRAKFPRACKANLRFGDDGAVCEATLLLFRNPNSYTGDDLVEIHAPLPHPLREDFLSALLKAGARMAKPGEFTQRAFLNGKLDLGRAEGVAAMIHARDEEERRLASALLQGSFSKRVEKLRAKLLDMVSLSEAALDFSDSDITLLTPEQSLLKIRDVQSHLQRMLEQGRREDKQGFGLARVLLLGPANAGKSTLFNALLGRNRAVVSPRAGTTRDLIEEPVTFASIPLLLGDCAGFKESQNLIDTLGMAATDKALRECDLAVIVLDAENSGDEDARALAEKTKNIPARIWVLNKRDLRGPTISRDIFSGEAVLELSAKTGFGLTALVETIKNALGKNTRQSDAFLLSSRNAALLEETLGVLERASKVLESGGPDELVAADLQNALGLFDAITGETFTEDVLGAIFSRFCIGK